VPPAAPQAPAPPAPDDLEAALLQRQAAFLRQYFFAATVPAALCVENAVSVRAVDLYLQRFRAEAGGPADPVERVLLDQLAVAHLQVGEYFRRAAEEPKLEFRQLYANTAVRLLGAVCQLASTLATCRASTRPRQCRRGRAAPRRPRHPTDGAPPQVENKHPTRQ
jgi:hypothetical protein